MDLLHAIEARRSPTKLTDPGPDADQLARILQAAIHAPDHGRLTPWRFTVLRGAARARLGDALAGSLLRRHPEATPEMLATESAKALRAPLIVVVAARTISGHKVPEVEQLLAVGAAVQNLLLAAQSLGFGSMWKTGAPAYDPVVKHALAIDPADSIAGFIYLGTAAGPAKPRDFPLEGLITTL